MPFTHLHVHTQYSLLDGAARIGELVARAKEQGMEALAITDHGVMYGEIEFYKACRAAGIKPILGMEAYVAPREMGDREGRREYAHLILLAKDETGYHNLMQLSSMGFLAGFYYKPRIDYQVLAQYAQGLVCTSACLAGDIPQHLLANDYIGAKAMAKRLLDIFGEDFYIELQDHGLAEQKKVLPGLLSIAAELGIKTIATNDVHYVRREDAQAQDVLLCIQTNRFVDEPDRMRMEAEEFYLKSPAQMAALFPDHPEALLHTQEIADKCNVEIDFAGRHLPGFVAPDGMENGDYLTKLCEEGLARKLPAADVAAHARLSYEIGVIKQMGFVDYFLIVWDFIHYAKINGIMVGPGRGSGAGSLAAYCMDITDIDPIKYGLIFERFLNPERISMPDFDIDFCYERRQEVIDYVVQKYGADHVAQIITFGSMAARAAVRDVGRVLRIPYGDVDKISKMVPAELNITLDRALSVSPELRTQYEQSDTVREILDLGRKLEGLPRHASTHAAGVVISKLPITDVVPLQKNDENVTTQFPMGTLEELGLLKMDFLGLRTLTVLRDTLDFIRAEGKEPPDLARIEFDDPAIYAMISAGETDGVFQLESAGMRQFLIQLKPDCFEDIIAGISLYRPGPMAQIPRYVGAKNGVIPVTYLHPKLEPILRNTYGCMVYQEQVMEIVRELAGYSLGRSDLVRRAMSKKKHDVMAKERRNFIYGNESEGVIGAAANGVPEQIADKIFDEMMDFASYAFNKSHAACYAVVAYRTAYLRRYFRAEFMAALLNSYIGHADKVAEYVYIARGMGVTVLPPDINKSAARFSVDDGKIRFGLSAVRNVGAAAMESMVCERERGGEFPDFFSFVERVDGLNKRMLEGLIYAGCFDSTGAKRAQLVKVYERVLEGSVQTRRTRAAGQISLFDLGGVQDVVQNARMQLPDIPELKKKEILEKEFEAIGGYISGHPLDDYAQTLRNLPYTIAQVMDASGGEDLPRDEERVRVGGLVRDMKQRPTKSGNGMMGYAALEGVTGRVELVLFPRTLSQFGSLFYAGSPVIVTGRLSIRDGQVNSILVDEAQPLEQAGRIKVLYLRFEKLGDAELEQAGALLSQYPGNVPVVLYDAATDRARRAPKHLHVNLSESFLQQARALLGEDNVKIKAK